MRMFALHNIYNSSDCPQINLRANSKGTLHESQRGLYGLSPLRSDGSLNNQAGRLNQKSGGQSNSRGAIRFESAQERAINTET